MSMRPKVIITLFQKMVWFTVVQAAVHEILMIKISKQMLKHKKLLQNPSISNTNVIETVSHSIINNIIFWICVTRPSRSIYVNCFNKLDFFLRSAQSCKKCTFLDNLMTTAHEGSISTRWMTPFFHLLFPV